jgi:hypothetical protein
MGHPEVDDWVRKFFPAIPSVDVASLAGVGAGDPVVAEVNSLGLSGIQLEAAGDDFHWLIPVPDEMAVGLPMKISALWTTDATTTTETATFKALYKAIAFGEALAAADVALDTVITADAVDDTAYGLQESPQGVINGGNMSKGEMLHILMELDAVSGLNPAADVVFLLGIFIEYIRTKI